MLQCACEFVLGYRGLDKIDITHNDLYPRNIMYEKRPLSSAETEAKTEIIARKELKIRLDQDLLKLSITKRKKFKK